MRHTKSSKSYERKLRHLGVPINENRKCQNCCKTDHWTYECKNGKTYKITETPIEKLKKFQTCQKKK